MVKLIFGVYMCYSVIGHTCCDKMAVFTFMFAVFLAQSTAEIKYFRLQKPAVLEFCISLPNFRFQVWRHHTFKNLPDYLHIRVLVRNLSASLRYYNLCFLKTVDTLKFYFQFWFWRFYCHRRVILYWFAKFRLNSTIQSRLWCHSEF